MGFIREGNEIGRLLASLEQEKIRYILIGMSAAIAQGIMGTTLDVDLWIDLPKREYMRVIQIALDMGAVPAANTVVYLSDGMPVNFVYEVDGLGSFEVESTHTIRLKLYERWVPVLSLQRIAKSKAAILRDKDKLHLKQIAEFLKCQKTIQKRRHPHR